MMFEGHVLVSPEHVERLKASAEQNARVITREELREDRRELVAMFKEVMADTLKTAMTYARPVPQTTHELLTSLAHVEKSQWAVAARVVKERTTPFKWFNGGKAFDIYVAKRYRAKYGQEPGIREVPNEPGYTGPIWVYPRTPEVIDWIMDIYRQYAEERQSGQASLF